MPRERRKTAYQYVSDFNRGHVITYRDCGLTHQGIAALFSHNPITESRIRRWWVHEGHTKPWSYGTQSWISEAITKYRENMHPTRMSLMDYIATLQDFFQNFCRLQNNKYLHKHLEDGCSSMDYQFCDHGFG